MVTAHNVYEPDLNSTLEEIHRFFEPYNKDLYELLTEFNLPVSAFETEYAENGPQPNCGKEVTAEDKYEIVLQTFREKHTNWTEYRKELRKAGLLEVKKRDQKHSLDWKRNILC